MIKKFKITILTFVFLLLIFVCSFFDRSFFTLISWIKNPALDFVLNWVTQITSTFVVLILMTTLFLWSERKREWVIPLWLSFFASIIIGYIIKFIVMRPRPFGLELVYMGIHDYSFPSVHAVAAFSALAILAKEYRKIKWFWLCFAILVSFSRIYVKIHYLSDVVAGAMLGFFIGYFVMRLEEKYHFFRKPKKL